MTGRRCYRRGLAVERHDPKTPADLKRAGWLDSDVFFALPNIQKPSKVLIAGPGPNGAPFHSDVFDFTGMTIALNRGILIPGQWDFFMAYDLGARDCEWYNSDQAMRAKRLLGALLARSTPNRRTDYTFETMPREFDDKPRYGCLHGGSTCCGVALLFCYWLQRHHPEGAMDISLLGIDQYGQYDYDGSISAPKYKKAWKTIANLNKIIGLLRDEGVSVRSISPTLLAV